MSTGTGRRAVERKSGSAITSTFPAAARSIAKKAVAAFGEVPFTPEVHRVAADADAARHRASRQAFDEQQHDAAPEHHALRRRSRPNPPLEHGATVGSAEIAGPARERVRLERAWFNTAGGAEGGIEESGRVDELHGPIRAFPGEVGSDSANCPQVSTLTGPPMSRFSPIWRVMGCALCERHRNNPARVNGIARAREGDSDENDAVDGRDRVGRCPVWPRRLTRLGPRSRSALRRVRHSNARPGRARILSPCTLSPERPSHRPYPYDRIKSSSSRWCSDSRSIQTGRGVHRRSGGDLSMRQAVRSC